VLDPASAINPTDSSPPDIRDLAQSAQDELKSISQSLLTARGIGGEVIVRYGNVRDIILQVQQECSADILVIGSSGRKIDRGKALGSTAEALLRGAPCDVLTIGPHVEWGSVSAKTRSLLSPTDYSKASLLALRVAISLAVNQSATLFLFHICDPYDLHSCFGQEAACGKKLKEIAAYAEKQRVQVEAFVEEQISCF
jgi:nucleotide-binding universal stress UspA family protein